MLQMYRTHVGPTPKQMKFSSNKGLQCMSPTPHINYIAYAGREVCYISIGQSLRHYHQSHSESGDDVRQQPPEIVLQEPLEEGQLLQWPGGLKPAWKTLLDLVCEGIDRVEGSIGLWKGEPTRTSSILHGP